MTPPDGPAVDRMEATHALLTEQVARLTGSAEWKAWLDAAARFPRYSFNNTVLIYAQNPDATAIAGFNRWKELGRSVNKGEHGLWIFAPVTRPEQRTDEHGRPMVGADGKPVMDRRIVNVKPIPVFDVAQTSGRPLPGYELHHPAPLVGQAPEGLWDGLVKFATDHGYTVISAELSGLRGYTHWAAHEIVVAAGMDAAASVKTLTHETAHMLLHDPAQPEWADYAASRVCRGTAEVEAESVAYLVAAQAGLDTSSYSFGYIGGWAGAAGPDVTEVIRATGQRVTATARQITAAVLPQQTDPLDASRAAQAERIARTSPDLSRIDRSDMAAALAAAAVSPAEVTFTTGQAAMVAAGRTVRTRDGGHGR